MLLAVPPAAPADAPLPLIVMLHGAGGDPGHALAMVEEEAARRRVLVLAPRSRQYTWDVLVGGYGPDVQALDECLEHVFRRCPVDARRVGIAGFSDGASYALCLGLANGDLVSGVVAFSPGFAAPAVLVGRPMVFISHGSADPVLPIDRTSRRVVPQLREGGYDLRYVEFAGGHVVPPDVVTTALDWFTALS